MKNSPSIQINATPQRVYQWYTRVESWKLWDHDVADACLDGGLRLGAKGYLQPKQGPKATMEVTQCVANTSFTVQSKLPLCQMVFTHQLVPNDRGVHVTHDVEFVGLLAPLFSRLIGKKILKNMPTTLMNLKKMVEHGG